MFTHKTLRTDKWIPSPRIFFAEGQPVFTLLPKSNHFPSSAWQISFNRPFQLTRTFQKSDNLETKREWLQTKRTEKAFDFRKLYISFPEYGQNVPGTILFRAPNNIVWGVKQYSFTCQTLLFRARKSNLWKMKRKNTGFHSLEGPAC